MTPEEKLAYNAQLGREQYQSKQVRRQQIRDRQIPSLQVQSWDSDRGAYRATAPDGTVRYVEPLTNGAIAAGDSVRPGLNRIDGMPHKKRAVETEPVTQEDARFWLLMEADLYEMVIRGNTAIANRIANSYEFPAPHDEFHNSELGLCRINAEEFYLATFDGIDRYNLTTKTAYTARGSRVRNSPEALNFTYGCSSLPNGVSFFGIEKQGSELGQIFVTRINPSDDSFEDVAFTTAGESPWSLGAVDENTVYAVLDYGTVSLIRFNTGERIDLFNVIGGDIGSLYGHVIDGYTVSEVTYLFPDPVTGDCYVGGLVIDNQDLPDYTVNLQYLGDAPSSLPFYSPDLRIISGNFPSHAAPGDSAPLFQIIQFLDDSTVYALANTWSGVESRTFNLSKRRNRTAIWKISPDLTVSLFFTTPGSEPRYGSTPGYRYFYNLPNRGAIFDPKTKNIFIHGFKDVVIENGVFVGSQSSPNDKPMTLINKSKNFKPLIVKPGKNAPSDFYTRWDWFSQLENIF